MQASVLFFWGLVFLLHSLATLKDHFQGNVSNTSSVICLQIIVHILISVFMSVLSADVSTFVSSCLETTQSCSNLEPLRELPISCAPVWCTKIRISQESTREHRIAVLCLVSRALHSTTRRDSAAETTCRTKEKQAGAIISFQNLRETSGLVESC